jgi:putative inorganic carbon (hco3(-)) transporter
VKAINICNKIIEYSFYAIFFFVPLVLAPDTSELFEFNKMWLTYILAIFIFAAWFSKMFIKRTFRIQRTPLDIPIILFLLSQVISTVFSLDSHISLWGYYSRFNGGLISIITYIFLYYAFVSNFKENAKTVVKRLIFVTLFSGAIVALWGLPSHFGYDPTCLVFRGTFDVSCWTADFQPRVRIFSTLGQPDWMAAYLAVLLPLIAGYLIKSPLFFNLTNGLKISWNKLGRFSLYFLIFILFFIDLLYTGAKSGFIAVSLSALVFAVGYVFLEIRNREKKDRKNFTFDFKLLAFAAVCTIIITFIVGTPFQRFRIFSYSGVKSLVTQVTTKPAANTTKQTTVVTPPPVPGTTGELGGTDSGTIRLYVWQGAIDAWLHNPIFGTGVETFAFAYYKYRPIGHNLTSEWRYLYNKAHNEFLNYLTTTGAFGLLTYLSIIILFFYLSVKSLLKEKGSTERRVLILALLCGYISMLVTNFFGFSVVIINLFVFLIPAFVFVLANLIDFNKAYVFSWTKEIPNNKAQPIDYPFSKFTWASIAVISVISLFSIFTLINYWNADRNYAKGYNYDRAGDYQTAYKYLHDAVLQRPGEPVFKDELSINDAVLAISLLSQNPQDQAQASQAAALAQNLAQEAVSISDEVNSQHPNNLVFWKTRVRVFYTLSQADERYLPLALTAIKKAAELAPTDADISYNLGVLYGQTGDTKSAVSTLENTVKLKPDLMTAYYALGIFYHQLAINDKGVVVNENYQKKAIDQMNYILKYSPTDSRSKDALKAWGVTQ